MKNKKLGILGMELCVAVLGNVQTKQLADRTGRKNKASLELRHFSQSHPVLFNAIELIELVLN